MSPLHGLGVLVTRPEQQALPLCALLEAQGAVVLRFPALDIAAVDDAGRTLQSLVPIGPDDIVIFTSANAVRCAAPWLTELAKAALAAIGPATARTLDACGYRAQIMPTAGAASEALLQNASLTDVDGRRVLLVKGRGGRDLLGTELRRRGARVMNLDTYRRSCPSPTPAELERLEAHFAGSLIHIVTATSAEIAANLLRMATPALRQHFERVTWVVPGERVACAVRDAGLGATLCLADTAEDQDLVAAIKRWRAQASGA